MHVPMTDFSLIIEAIKDNIQFDKYYTNHKHAVFMHVVLASWEANLAPLHGANVCVASL